MITMGLFHANTVRAEVRAAKDGARGWARDRLGRGDRETGAGYVYDAGIDWGSPAAQANLAGRMRLAFRDAERGS